MSLEDAKRAGADAFIAGRPRAPALNQEFISAACAASSVGGLDLSGLLEAYLRGWTVALLAENSPVPTMPSRVEFDSIMVDADRLAL